MRTIAGTYTNGVLLTDVTTNPITVTTAGLIKSAANNFALIGGSLKNTPDYNFPWTIVNGGKIEGKGTNSTGVVLYGGGLIENFNYIGGGQQGIYTYYQPATVENSSTISAYGTSGIGVFLSKGGRVANEGMVLGTAGGIKIAGANATVSNYGTITNRAANAPFAVALGGFTSSFLTNGSSGYINGNVTEAGAAKLVNTGTIKGNVSFSGAGSITNGIAGSTAAHIDGFFNGIAGRGTVTNYGTISGFFAGIDLAGGGVFDNARPGAVVKTSNSGQDGILMGNYGSSTVTNLGTVAVYGSIGAAVDLGNGGTVTNGAPTVTSAEIEFTTGVGGDGDGIVAVGPGAITNFATINATAGILLAKGGSIANSGTAALIEGRLDGILATNGGAAAINNTGTIESDTSGFGISLAVGTVVNGSPGAAQALIAADPSGFSTPGASIPAGSFGVSLTSGATLINYGIVEGARSGAYLTQGAIANGASGSNTGLIEGKYYGVQGNPSATQSGSVTNFGTIAAVGTAGIGVGLKGSAGNTLSNSGVITGSGGTAVLFGAGNDRLIVNPGALFNGFVQAGSGTNEIDFNQAGPVSLDPEFVGFSVIRLAAGGANSLTLSDTDFTGLAGDTVTVFGGDAGNTIDAGSLSAPHNATLVGGSATDVLTGGAADDMLTGGADADRFVFAPGGGADTVTDFASAGGDRIDLLGYANIAALSELVATAVQSGADAVLNLDAGDSVTLQNVTIGNLTAADFIFNSNGFIVSSGQTVPVPEGQTDSGVTVLSGGNFIVGSGGVASGTQIGGGTLTVSSGGATVGTAIDGGGTVLVLSGGSDAGTVVDSGGLAIFLGTGGATTIGALGADFVESGGSTSGTSLLGGDEFVEAGGSTSGTVVANGSQEVFGLAAGTVINGANARLDLYAGGTTIGTVVSNGVELVIGTASGTVDLPGGFDFVYGSAAGTVVGGGAEFVELGAVASGTTLDGGAQVVYGTANGTVIDSGGTAYFLSGSVVSGVVVNNGLAVTEGLAIATVVASGSFDFVEPGATALGAVLNGGDQYVEAGAVTIGTVIGNGAVQVDLGLTSGSVIDGGGFEYVYPGGTASGTTVNDGGVDNIFVGTAFGTVDNSGGKDFIYSGLASGTIVAGGGGEFVEFGGTAVGTLVSGAGGTQDVVAGAALNTVLISGGVQIVEAGETAGNTTVGTGGYEFVGAGGTAAGAAISGGIVELTAGATGAVGFATGAGGLLKLDDAQHFAGTVAGFGLPGQIDLEDIAFGANTTSSFQEAAGNFSGTLTVGDGTRTANITLLGNYIAGQFHLSGDGGAGTLVTDPPVPPSSEFAANPLVIPRNP